MPSKHHRECVLVLHVTCDGIHAVLSTERLGLSSDSGHLVPAAP
jgi:hypothetical protein